VQDEPQFAPPNMIPLYNDLILLEVPQETVNVEPLTEEQRQMWESGVPLMAIVPPKLDSDAVFAMLEKVKEILKKHQPERAAEIEKTWAALPTGPKDRQIFVNSLVSREGNVIENMLRGNEVSEDILAFLLNQALKPFVMAYAEKIIEEVNEDHWGKGYCPACGSLPNFARLSKAVGRRSLYCSLCETEWPYMRIGCPFCGTSDADNLRYFTVDDDSRYRVYVCENCRGYIKTIDESKAAENEKIYLFLEDIKTIHLDVLAMREGYTNKAIGAPV